jgi:hypothetical protein
VSNPTTSAPAGWYADPNGAPTLRWWDGTAWSDQYLAPSVPGLRPSLPASTPVNTPWIWVIVFLPLLPYVPFFFWDFGAFMTVPPNPSAISNFFAVYVAILLFSVISYGINVWFSFLDWRDLERRGVVRPFHWAWGFVPSWPVYLIGRTVIVHQVSKRGLGPIWGYVGMFVANIAISLVWTLWIMQSMMQNFPYDSFSSYGSYS